MLEWTGGDELAATPAGRAPKRSGDGATTTASGSAPARDGRAAAQPAARARRQRPRAAGRARRRSRRADSSSRRPRCSQGRPSSRTASRTGRCGWARRSSSTTARSACSGAPAHPGWSRALRRTSTRSFCSPARELPWRAGPPGLEKGSSICHGTAGNGYALPEDVRAHRRRGVARPRPRFAVHALEQVERRGRGRYSLWTGDLGVALYAADCLEPRTAIRSSRPGNSALTGVGSGRERRGAVRPARPPRRGRRRRPGRRPRRGRARRATSPRTATRARCSATPARSS